MVCQAEDCDKKLNSNNNSGYCKDHWHHSIRKNSCDKLCVVEGCNKALGTNNKSGYCWPAHRDLSPIRKEQQKTNGVARYLKNGENIKQQPSQWAKDNRSRRNEITKKWFKANLERYRGYSQKRRALKLGQFVEDIDLFSVWCRDSGLCFLCGFPADKSNWWLEHAIPLSKGGLHAYSNVAVSHEECNRKKNDKWLEEWDNEVANDDRTHL